MATETAPPPGTPPPKFSRYRSVRRAQAQQPPLLGAHSQQNMPPIMPPLPATEPQSATPISRSMSRYHRRPATSNTPGARAPPTRSATVQVPPLPTATAATAATAATSHTSRYRALSSPQAPNTSRARAEAAPAPAPARTTRDEARRLMLDAAEQHHRLKEKQHARAEQAERECRERLQREEEEAQRVWAEREAEREAEAAAQTRRQQTEKERGKRLQKAESAKRVQERQSSQPSQPLQQSPPTSPPRHAGAFGLFRRKAGVSSPGSPPASSGAVKPPPTSHGGRDMDNIKVGGGGAVLGIDAPISAVNAGDRRVTIVCNKEKFLLPVTPDTTAHDLLKSAALCMAEDINPRTDIVIENFHKVGIQRPVRLYERVRDILNSWDNDMQNDLEVVNALYFGQIQSHLVATDVPSEKPEDIGCWMSHSSKPGKWNKKYVLFRSDGQLGLAKNEEAKDMDTLCHLSDFDVYVPTRRKSTKIKPPKKDCYAVKSQQKSNIFSDESRYVHFFCTNNPKDGSAFLTALQVWRSWHLKHVMGEGQSKAKAKAVDAKPTNGVLANAKALSCLEQNGTSSHNRSTSVGSYYQLGSFQPLFDTSSFGKDIGAANLNDTGLQRSNTKAMHVRRMSTRGRKPPPSAFGRSGALINDVPSLPQEPSKPLTEITVLPDDAFAATGLLGRAYTVRQKTVQEREKKNAGPFIEGPSLVSNIDTMAAAAAANESGLSRRASVHSTTQRRTSSDIQRSASTKMRVKPLIDLTPQYREPPQHRNKGKGFAPGAGTGPLVENATSVEEAIKVPSSTDWRRPATTRATHGTYGNSSYERTKSLKGRGEGLAAYTVNNHDGAPSNPDAAFTGGGLLARAGFSQGHQPVGRGVMDGSKATGPMLDMAENAQFASGSLLADMQRKQAAG
ncbi:hypothetical protein P280DRAFT_19292 [Massarina eburnea CBS 473.64]|uniref:PH domain-containing protein n=1 Tax=Massarina eburnea CBS 473.64 TaxID=1395130 RepID=A0A6A6SIH3_9PLEO|nr:hypothetical protein P280DRAFT_19292 [Massarina eburnea CBS 473.64]